MNKTEIEERSIRINEYREAIFEAIPDGCDAEELCVSGLSIFLQAALVMAEDDITKVHKLVNHVIELAQELNKADEEAGIWPIDYNNKMVH